MTTVVIGNPIRNLRAIIDQIFQGIQNLFFPVEGGLDAKQNDPKAKGIDAFREIKEPHKYTQKGGIKQMCTPRHTPISKTEYQNLPKSRRIYDEDNDAHFRIDQPYETLHAYGLVYDWEFPEGEKVALSFSGEQYQVYLERATELCDDDPDCNYFSLWTDGGITKYSECDSMKDTINSTITYEKISPPPVPGTECEDKGYQPYDWYDFQKNKVSLSTGAGEAKSEWNVDGKCTRVSCKNSESKELNEFRQCVPTTVENLSDAEQRQLLNEQKAKQQDIDNVNAKYDKIKELKDTCAKNYWDAWTTHLENTGQFLTEHKWNPSGQGYNLTSNFDCEKFANMEYERSHAHKHDYNQYYDGYVDEWSGPNDAAAGWW